MSKPWCFCPYCAHLRNGEKPWKNPRCSVCDSTGRVDADRMCLVHMLGYLKAECPACKEKITIFDKWKSLFS